jgi:hypothetical protein
MGKEKFKKMEENGVELVRIKEFVTTIFKIIFKTI